MARLTMVDVEKRCPDIKKGQKYKGALAKYVFICSIHGEYLQTYGAHYLAKQSCPQCGYAKCGAKKKLYFRDPDRECQLKMCYGLTADDTDFLYRIQKGLCLWCKAVLPLDSIRCSVDHIGGFDTYRDRSKVRGLCCPHNFCNLLSGKVEQGKFILGTGTLLKAFINNVKKVIKTNKGNIKFPKKRLS